MRLGRPRSIVVPCLGPPATRGIGPRRATTLRGQKTAFTTPRWKLPALQSNRRVQHGYLRRLWHWAHHPHHCAEPIVWWSVPITLTSPSRSCRPSTPPPGWCRRTSARWRTPTTALTPSLREHAAAPQPVGPSCRDRRTVSRPRAGPVGGQRPSLFPVETGRGMDQGGAAGPAGNRLHLPVFLRRPAAVAA